MSDHIINKLKSLISELSIMDNSLFVLKGFPLTTLWKEDVFIDEMVGDKFSYYIKLMQNQRKYVIYEEFICLYEFFIRQFKYIYVIDNNIYMNLYPLYAKIDNDVLSRLKKHYNNENQDDDFIIGDLFEYTYIYSNYTQIRGLDYIIYNESPELLKNEKIRIKYLFQVPELKIKLKELEESELLQQKNYVDICDETDYVMMTNMLNYYPKELFINIENSIIEKSLINSRLKLIMSIWGNRSNIYECKIKYSEIKKNTNDEYVKILKKYWGKQNFRTLSIYDTAKVDNGKKEVIEVSQEDIITDLVNEIEKCQKGNSYRDLFVTAPTGAGKSAMFQIPAIYIAQKYEHVTLVISPLIGLMNDQVKNLEIRNYEFVRTINSDISQIIRQEIINEVADKKCHILYLSPESLLSRSDVEQLIGERTIGMIVVDEAHIVTTWGKQFRPDYWYLGDHIRKLRKTQRERRGHSFVIATFTATAIYGGLEDMWKETINSLHMIRPISYLGLVKREDIYIDIKEVKVVSNRTEYELEKFDQIIAQIERACCTGKKTLIYFPTVALIDRFYDYCYNKNLNRYVTRYHGQLENMVKQENYEQFLSGERIVMLATKAFGMGIDIDDIEIVSHFAPTGNVCDYVQEIGRAARKNGLSGEAVYNHMKNDFKHINRLHGLSTIRSYQLVEVIKKVYELYRNNLMNQDNTRITKKRNEILVDAESFAYIFDNSMSDESDVMNKVKTAMLIIQKDYENRQGFSPFSVRPIPMFATGYFAISKYDQDKINKKYKNIITELVVGADICKVDLKRIWQEEFNRTLSFPKFKYLLYTRNKDLKLCQDYSFTPALSVDVYFENDSSSIFNMTIEVIREVIWPSIYEDKYISQEELAQALQGKLCSSIYKMRSLVSILIAAMDTFKKSFSAVKNSNIYNPRLLKNGNVIYRFNNPVEQFLKWIERGFNFIKINTNKNKLYLINDGIRDRGKEYTIILGILEAFSVLTFKSLGGASSQIYIYVKQTKAMQMVINKPNTYRNRLLEMVGDRHKLSVAMLSFLFQSNLSSEEIWNYIEDYFLGKIPEEVKGVCNDKGIVTE